MGNQPIIRCHALLIFINIKRLEEEDSLFCSLHSISIPEDNKIQWFNSNNCSISKLLKGNCILYDD